MKFRVKAENRLCWLLQGLGGHLVWQVGVTQAVMSLGLACCGIKVHLPAAAEDPVGASAWDMEHGSCQAVPADPTTQGPVAELNPFSRVLNPFPAR